MTHLEHLRSKLRKYHPSTKEAEKAKERVMEDIDKQEFEEEQAKK